MAKSSEREYASWRMMRYRCENPNCDAYPDYGGRGITVCERWQSHENFVADMGRCPPGLTLERKDNDQGYSPENCCWATYREQANNMRPTRSYEYREERLSLAQWARRIGVSYSVLRHRLDRGWPIERALTEPLHPNKRRRKGVQGSLFWKMPVG